MLQEEALKRRKTLIDGSRDLISELPVDVIDVILEHLPVRDAARMSVLSHKWFDIWRSIQKLVLDAEFFKRLLKNKKNDSHEISRIVSDILFYHSGPLLKFHLCIPRMPRGSWCIVDPWISHLSSVGVSDISIQNQSMVVVSKLSSIFSCDRLEKLTLQRVIINPPRNFGGFRKMKCLELDNITITGESFNHLIRNCPLLQKLKLTYCAGIDRIVINFPNLTHLILDSMNISLDIRNAENLVSAVFGLYYLDESSYSTCSRGFIKDLANSRKLEKLVLKAQFCKIFFQERLLPPAFDKLRELELPYICLNNTADFYPIINVIQSCPAIEILHISVAQSNYPMSDTVDYNPDVVLHRLCYVDLSIASGSVMELKLIELLLGCSPVLNKLSITTTGKRKKVFQPNFVNKLNRFRRASQKAEVICPDSCF